MYSPELIEAIKADAKADAIAHKADSYAPNYAQVMENARYAIGRNLASVTRTGAYDTSLYNAYLSAYGFEVRELRAQS